MKITNYDEWNILKKNINFNYKKLYYPKIREIWWINIGLNIGTEIYGKTDQYTRPVLIMKIYDNSFLGLPISSQIKKDKSRPKIYTDDLRCHSVILKQMRVFDRKRLIKRKYIISKNKFKKILSFLKNMITTD
jgi:mRNA interferase MazF